MTIALLILCGFSCLLLSFTDSFKDKNGNIYYGFATTNGLWVIDGSATLPPELVPQYRLKFIDFLHAFMSLLVFGAVALFDDNVVRCFYPSPSLQVKEVLTALPIGIGVISSTLFVVFPTTRHGIGYPPWNITIQKDEIFFRNMIHSQDFDYPVLRRYIVLISRRNESKTK